MTSDSFSGSEVTQSRKEDTSPRWPDSVKSPNQASKHLLVYEPRTEGHHLGWLRFLAEDLLSANYQISLAVDLRSGSKERVEESLAELCSEVRFLSAYNASGRRHGDGLAGSVAMCLRTSQAGRVFLAAFDEIASACWRRSAVGLNPPADLRGRMGGIYHRPRFLVAPWWSPNRWLKRIGFARLIRRGWLGQLLFVDEFLTSELQSAFPSAPLFFLPDPCPTGYGGEGAPARRQLDLPADKRVLLFYGTGHKRKGLHLAVEVILGLPREHPAFLLCAGQLRPQGRVLQKLERLCQQGRARLIDRYVSTAEEKLCFAACDAVLLPYVNHFGTSGVLSRAMASGKPVVASDQQLLGRLTREHGLGLVFPAGDVSGLKARISEVSATSAEQLTNWREAARRYAQRYSREVFRASLLAALDTPQRVRAHA